MDGIQKTMYDGLIAMADKIEAGVYGIGDDCCQGDDDCDGNKFCSDMCDEVMGKMN